MLKSELAVSSNLVGFSDIRRDPIGGWQEFLGEGNEFLATASNAFGLQRKAFTPEILYNLVAMSIEKLIMAMLMKSGNLPYNHTMHDLVDSMNDFLPGKLMNLGDELKALDAYQEICDVESYSIKPPAMTEVAMMLDLAAAVQTLTMKSIID